MILIALAIAQAAPAAAPAPVPPRIERLLDRAPVIDGHNDLPWELRERYGSLTDAIAGDTTRAAWPLQTDIARLRKGHVGAQFWSVWIPATAQGPRAVEMTVEQIDLVRRMVAAHPDAFRLAGTAADVRAAMKAGRIASLIGVEGGHQIDANLAVLRQYRALGVAYMTLTHSQSLEWADSSTGTVRAGGLSPFGRQVVAEMNRLGMIVDVSHVADTTMAQALDVSKAPVIASHSGARAIADAPRNIPDDLLRRIGATGGVVMVNFYPAFVSAKWRAWDRERGAFAKGAGVDNDVYDDRAPAPLLAWQRTHPEPAVTVADVADHIEHVAKVAGRASVGLGGDFDGISGTGPVGLKGVEGYPAIFAELARRGWSDADLAGLSQGNVLRVMERVEAVARAMKDEPPAVVPTTIR
ncbi:dipeptidase [Sphingomonas sp. Leaf412]|uniref:dipeptidase n=1 Tax=Sphingomonas sp. Leaf412 TaxID=1736370 RepID=UPI000B0AEAE9|nr:dipeptidase [Sphingomonas sp. Leaf412]